MKITDSFLPDELKEHFSKMETWENGGLLVKSVDYGEDDIIVKFEVYFGDNLGGQEWLMTVKNVKAAKVIWTRDEYIEIYNDHYLLWKFTDDEIELYVNGTSDSAEVLAANFYTLHQKTFGEWLPIETFVHNLLSLCKSKQALFAKGPKRLLEYYASWLSDYGRNPYFLEFEGLTNANVRANRIPLKLLTFGKSYFIGQDIVLNKVNS